MAWRCTSAAVVKNVLIPSKAIHVCNDTAILIPYLISSTYLSSLDYRYRSKTAVDHVIREHGVVYPGCKLYKCYVERGTCRFSTYQVARLRQHMVTKHSSGKVIEQYKCKTCDQTFQKPYLLRAHIKQAHPEMAVAQPKKFKCEQCGHQSRYVQRY